VNFFWLCFEGRDGIVTPRSVNLLILKVNQLGDNVVFLPVVQMLRRLVQEWQITLFTSPVAVPLYTKDLRPEQIIAVPTAEFNKAWKQPWRLPRYLVKAVAVKADATLIANDQGNVAHLLAMLCGGRTRVGLMRDYIKFRGGLTDEVAVSTGTPAAMMNWLLAARLLERFGISGCPDVSPPPDLSHLSGDQKPARRHVVIHAGGSIPIKRWFPERFVELANRLSADCEVSWIVQGLEEAALLPAVRQVRTPSLESLVQLLASANLLIGNNSGPMNLAVAMGIPSVILNGPSSFIWDPFWYPERCLMLRDRSLPCLPCDSEIQPATGCMNLANPMACMKAWTVDVVEMRCREWLERWPVESFVKASSQKASNS